jgi:intraflagellar transport protein 172
MIFFLQQIHRSFLYRYVAIYWTEQIKQQRSSVALELFIKYGSPAKSQNLNIYRHLATEILLEDKNDIKSLIVLRNIFHSLVFKNLNKNTFEMLGFFLFIKIIFFHTGEGSDITDHQHGIRALPTTLPLHGDQQRVSECRHQS